MFSKSKCPVRLESGQDEVSKVGAGDSGTLSQKAHFVKALGNGGSDFKYSGAVEGWETSCNKMAISGESVLLHRQALVLLLKQIPHPTPRPDSCSKCLFLSSSGIEHRFGSCSLHISFSVVVNTNIGLMCAL